MDTQREGYNRDRSIACRDLGITVADYNYIRLQGSRLRSVYVANCNGEYESEDEYYTACGVFEGKIEARIKPYGLHVYYQTDPRGASVYLSRSPIDAVNYNSIGSHCIY